MEPTNKIVLLDKAKEWLKEQNDCESETNNHSDWMLAAYIAGARMIMDELEQSKVIESVGIP